MVNAQTLTDKASWPAVSGQAPALIMQRDQWSAVSGQATVLIMQRDQWSADSLLPS